MWSSSLVYRDKTALSSSCEIYPLPSKSKDLKADFSLFILRIFFSFIEDAINSEYDI
jgi:hypothetical protein